MMTSSYSTKLSKTRQLQETILDTLGGPMPPEKLTGKQHRALELVLYGWSDTQIAEELKLNRTTVLGWRHRHSGFKLALQRLRQDQYENMRDRIRGLAEKAISVVQAALEENSLPAAIAVLKACGFSDPSIIRGELEARNLLLVEEDARETREKNQRYLVETIRRLREEHTSEGIVQTEAE